MTVGERIRELRERLGINQVDFADKIGVSKQTLYKYENNLITNIKLNEGARRYTDDKEILKIFLPIKSKLLPNLAIFPPHI